MDLTVIIPFYNGHTTIEGLLKTIPETIPVIIVNDQSDENIGIDLPENVKVLNLKNKGYFSGAVNAGISACKTDILVLNQDVRFEGTQWLDLIADNKGSHAMIGERIKGMHPAWVHGYIHGTFMFMRRDAISKVGLLNEELYPVWGATCEWQLRACRRDFSVLPVPIVPGFFHSRKGGVGSAIKALLKKESHKKSLFIRTPPLISVIVPTFNHGKYAQDLVNSLIGGHTTLGVLPGQTLQSFEIIFADDCSDDGSYEQLQELADPWKGIHVYQTHKNGGTSRACNLAITHSNAPIIARIDGDDMRETGSLERMYKSLQETPKSFIYDDVRLFVHNKRMPKVWVMPSEYDFDELLQKNRVHAGIMFPKEAFDKVGGYSEVMRNGRDDWAFNVGLEIQGYCGKHLEYPGYLYRREGQNRTIRNTTPRWRAIFLDQMKSLYPNIYAGERPMGCCGGRTMSPTAKSAPSTYKVPVDRLTGSTGMVLITYTGDNFGLESYVGPITGAVYRFSKKKHTRYVDVRDLNLITPTGKGVGLLDILTPTGVPVFKQTPKKSPRVTPEVEEKAPDLGIAVSEELVVVADEVIMESEPFNFTSLKGIGYSTAEKLAEADIRTLDEFLSLELGTLAGILGWSLEKTDNLVNDISE